MQKPNLFIDEQRVGPYRVWHHQHFFREVAQGVEVEDIVDYVMPFGPIGAVVHSLFVRKQVEEIFDYRAKVLKERFGEIDSKAE